MIPNGFKEENILKNRIEFVINIFLLLKRLLHIIFQLTFHVKSIK